MVTDGNSLVGLVLREKFNSRRCIIFKLNSTQLAEAQIILGQKL